jgi:xanthine dehydrogenase YagT iron-sulfur-binding subunit
MPVFDKPTDPRRRTFIKILGAGMAGAGAAAAGVVAPSLATEAAEIDRPPAGTEILDVTVNGRRHRLHLEPRTTLAELLRDHLGLTGTKITCNRGMCGSCTVLVNDVAVYSCHMLALDAAGKTVTTVEGLMNGEELHPLQQAFVDHDGLQCGFCTPGQVMAAEALLRAKPHPTADDIRAHMAGNLCRCGAYPKILESIEAARKP